MDNFTKSNFDRWYFPGFESTTKLWLLLWQPIRWEWLIN